MRRAVKKQILEIMDSICLAAVEVIGGKIQGDRLLHTLIQCQECAVLVGTAIEEEQGEGSEVLEKIEHFCELLYQTAQNVDGVDVVRKLGKVLHRKSIEIQNSIKNTIPIRLEVLFLPYKACMWDSLESIWSAAFEDPDCDAYVVPIPYMDKLPTGGFGSFYYEIMEYPDHIPVIDYKSYDIEKRKPDVICIHNPYDDTNTVTSVLPEHFVSNLKKYTDMLVYVPYFITNRNVIAPYQCVLPGTIFADKVVVESESILETYENELKRYYQEKAELVPEGWIKKKFLVLGSPKIDKVLGSRREDFKLPQEWQALIKDKKVILYNTHLGGLINNGEQFLRKLRYVLHRFDQQTDIVLWWRPHPLSQSTMKAMNPSIFSKYQIIVEEYREGGKGVYDHTANLHRAIAMTDAYYGDWSSLVTMYKATGKPIMVQNMDIVEEDMGESEWLW